MPDHSPASGNPMNPALRLAERYRDDAPIADAWSPIIESLLQHRSVRAYTSQPLASGTLETLVAAAQSAATSSNLQTWSVVAIRDQARKDRLAAIAGGQKHISRAPLFLCWIADLSRAARLAAAADRALEAVPFLEVFLVAVIDAALAAQNAVVAAESLGLGTVYIGAMRNNPKAVADELHLPLGSMAVFGLCVGHEDLALPASVKPRLPQKVVLHHETYDPSHEAAAVATYNETLHSFQREQSMRLQGWSDLLLNRLGVVAALSGRDHLKDAIQALGFELR